MTLKLVVSNPPKDKSNYDCWAGEVIDGGGGVLTDALMERHFRELLGQPYLEVVREDDGGDV